jgi:hypothetical protein
MCPHAYNSGVHVRVWAVRRDVPVSLVPRIVGSDPEPKKDGNHLVVVLAGAPYHVFRSTLQGLNQSIVSLLPLSETA